MIEEALAHWGLLRQKKKEKKERDVLDRTEYDARFVENDISDSNSIEDKRDVRHEDCGGCDD